jgi:hypothetical protein
MRVDFHSHTNWSDDSLLSPKKLVEAARRAGLDKIVVSDHNEINGALEAQEIAPELVIVGEEIMTSRGEILAAYVKERIQPYLSPIETLERLKEQGAFISLSHPFDRHRMGGWTLEEIENMLPYLDALETLNARTIHAEDNQKAADYALKHNLPAIAGSDSHSAKEVGKVWIDLHPFDDASSLRTSVKDGRIDGSVSPFWVHFYSRWAKFRKKISQP